MDAIHNHSSHDVGVMNLFAANWYPSHNPQEFGGHGRTFFRYKKTQFEISHLLDYDRDRNRIRESLLSREHREIFPQRLAADPKLYSSLLAFVNRG